MMKFLKLLHPFSLSSMGKTIYFIGFIAIFSLSGCQANEISTDAVPAQIETTPTITATFLEVEKTSTPEPKPEILPVQPTEVAVQLCSLFLDVEVQSLPELITNPFHPPAPGSDDPHQGIDLSRMVNVGNTRIAVKGDVVTSMTEGQVAAIIHDRFPYGNAILIEIPLKLLPEETKDQIIFQSPLKPTKPSLSCPETNGSDEISGNEESLYILYAHLESLEQIKVNDPVHCVQPLGKVGDSGNALNPHLHLEMRIGPSGITFASMSHYDNSATPEEMAAYCTWRVSGKFQLVDPLKFIELGQSWD